MSGHARFIACSATGLAQVILPKIKRLRSEEKRADRPDITMAYIPPRRLSREEAIRKLMEEVK